MKLYFSKGACSLAVRILINELKMKCEFESVDSKSKQTETGKNYLTINPKGAVPALELDNGEVLTENAVIHQYLAELKQATDLLPPTSDFKHYRVLEWLNYITTDVHKNFGPYFSPVVPDDVKNNFFKPLLVRRFNFVNSQLDKKRFLLGDTFTLPDGYLFVMLGWAHRVKLPLDDQANLMAYFSRLKERDSIRQALKAENIEL
jgi:glutathione S-transferase